MACRRKCREPGDPEGRHDDDDADDELLSREDWALARSRGADIMTPAHLKSTSLRHDLWTLIEAAHSARDNTPEGRIASLIAGCLEPILGEVDHYIDALSVPPRPRDLDQWAREAADEDIEERLAAIKLEMLP